MASHAKNVSIWWRHHGLHWNQTIDKCFYKFIRTVYYFRRHHQCIIVIVSIILIIIGPVTRKMFPFDDVIMFSTRVHVHVIRVAKPFYFIKWWPKCQQAVSDWKSHQPLAAICWCVGVIQVHLKDIIVLPIKFNNYQTRDYNSEVQTVTSLYGLVYSHIQLNRSFTWCVSVAVHCQNMHSRV